MSALDFEWALELRRTDDTHLTQVRISPRWGPAREWIRLLAARRGVIPLGTAARVAEAEPRWHPTRGAPFASGFRARLAERAGQSVAADFSLTYFADVARQASSSLVESGVLKEGEQFLYLPIAYPRDTATSPEGTPSLLRELDALVPILEQDMRALHGRSDNRGTTTRGDMPVFIPQQVLDEASDRARHEPGREVGGVLIGRIHRDNHARNRSRRRDLFMEVTAQIPARADGDGTRLSFTADTWTDVQAALTLRRQGEVMLGWWHSHLMHVLCGSCPTARQQTCALASGFLSADDRALHTTVFPRAYSIALVMSLKTDDTISEALFGWRMGLIARRGFSVIDARERVGAVQTPLGNEPAGDHPQADATPECSLTDSRGS